MTTEKAVRILLTSAISKFSRKVIIKEKSEHAIKDLHRRLNYID